jgi:hypothetical protein
VRGVAGVSALVIGIAARSVLGNLLAGLQIALSQPIRIDDVPIVENEWGRVEEISGTYVVLKMRDERRLVIRAAARIQRSQPQALPRVRAQVQELPSRGQRRC